MDIKKENLYVAQKVKTLEAFKSLDNDREFNDLYWWSTPHVKKKSVGKTNAMVPMKLLKPKLLSTKKQLNLQSRLQ